MNKQRVQVRWVVHQEPKHEEISWHRTLGTAIKRAEAYHRLDGLGYTIDLEIVPTDSLGRRTGDPIESYPDQWDIKAKEQ